MRQYCLSNRNYKILKKMFDSCSSSSSESLSDFTYNKHIKSLLQELNRCLKDNSIIPNDRPSGGEISVQVDSVLEEANIRDPDVKLSYTVVRQVYNILAQAGVVEEGVNPKTFLKGRWKRWLLLDFKKYNY